MVTSINVNSSVKATEVGGYCHQLSSTFSSPAVIVHHHVYRYQMTLTYQVPLVTNFSSKLVTVAVEF